MPPKRPEAFQKTQSVIESKKWLWKKWNYKKILNDQNIAAGDASIFMMILFSFASQFLSREKDDHCMLSKSPLLILASG